MHEPPASPPHTSATPSARYRFGNASPRTRFCSPPHTPARSHSANPRRPPSPPARALPPFPALSLPCAFPRETPSHPLPRPAPRLESPRLSYTPLGIHSKPAPRTPTLRAANPDGAAPAPRAPPPSALARNPSSSAASAAAFPDRLAG